MAALCLSIGADPSYGAQIDYHQSNSSVAEASVAAPTAPVPTLVITNPSGTRSYPLDGALGVSWTSDQPLHAGEFGLWVRSASGGWYLTRLVAVNGGNRYSAVLTLTVPAGLGYQAVVAYRPIAGSGDWTSWATSPGSFAVGAAASPTTTVTTVPATTNTTISGGALNVKGYGAKGDGLTDDQTAIQACIDAASAAGREVYIPAGTYRINSSISTPSGIVIRGAGETSILASYSADAVSIGNNKSNVTLRDFAIKGDYSAAARGVDVGYGFTNTGLSLINLTISDFTTSGVFLAANSVIKNFYASGCTIYHCGVVGMVHPNGGGGSNWLIENCVVYNLVGSTEPEHAYYFHDIANLTMTGCEAHTVGTTGNGSSGYEFDDCTNVYLDTCSAHDCKTPGAASDGYGFIAVGSTTVTYRNCVGWNNLYDFFECGLTGAATYESCTGTTSVLGL